MLPQSVSGFLPKHVLHILCRPHSLLEHRFHLLYLLLTLFDLLIQVLNSFLVLADRQVMCRKFRLQRIILFLRDTDLLDYLLKRDRATGWSTEGEVSSVVVREVEELELVLGGILAFRIAF